jgi:hypothetical protein
MIESSYAKFSASKTHALAINRINEIERIRDLRREAYVDDTIAARRAQNAVPRSWLDRFFCYVFNVPLFIETDRNSVIVDVCSWNGFGEINRLYEREYAACLSIARMCENMTVWEDKIYLCDAHVSAIYSPLT